MTAPTTRATPKKALDQRATSRHDNACLNPRGLYNRPLQLRIANTTIMIIEFH
jgi:hypothetical protein